MNFFVNIPSFRSFSFFRSYSSKTATPPAPIESVVPSDSFDLEYPEVRRGSHEDIYKSTKAGARGVRVADPYRWLEEDSPETEKFLKNQSSIARRYLDLYREKSRFEKELKNNWDYSRFSAPSRANDGRWYWYFNSGLQQQYVLYRTPEKQATFPDFDANAGPEATAEVFFDPNLLVEDATAHLATTAFSKCGKYFAYGVSLSGSDFFTIYVRETNSPFNQKPEGGFVNDPGRMSDVVRFVKFSSIDWTHDSKGFFYQRFPERQEHGAIGEDKAGTETVEDKNAAIYYHRLGTDQSRDTLVHKDDDNPFHYFGIGVSETDGRYIELYTSKDTSGKTKLWIADLKTIDLDNFSTSDLKWFKIVDDFEADYNVIANKDKIFYILTDKDAPRKKVATFVLPDQPVPGVLSMDWHDFLPEDPSGGILVRIGLVNGETFALTYSRNVRDELHILSLDGRTRKQLDEDFVGTLSFSCKVDRDYFFVNFSGFSNPGIIKMYSFAEPNKAFGADDKWAVFRTTVLKGLVPEEFTARQEWYKSKDDTKIPMFIVSHRDTPRDGTAPALQYGYGGFNHAITPFFSPAMLTWIKAYRGIIAVPGIRGGSEFGKKWHLDGIREKRVNVFADFIAAANYLMDKGYAGRGKVAINGGSNGGTLVAACINLSPATFGAAVAEVGVMDLLRFPHFTIGAAWVSDYGDPREPDDFDFIHPYSPLHNIPKENDRLLPPTLLLTADHDDRVVPLHSFKHIATMQYEQKKVDNHNPLLLRVELKSGHGAGKSTEKAIREAVDKWGFVAHVLDLEWHD